MVKEASGVVISQTPPDIRLVKPFKVVVKGSLDAESSDFAQLARTAQIVAGTAIPKDLPYRHVSEGHGYPLEELDPGEAPFIRADNMPVEGVSVSKDAIVTYSIEKDPSHLIVSTGGAMAVAISSEGLVAKQAPEPEVVNLNMAFRDKDPLLENPVATVEQPQGTNGVIDQTTQEAQAEWAKSLLGSIK